MTDVVRKLARTEAIKFAGAVAEDEAVLLASTANVDLMGDIVVQSGIDYQTWLRIGGTITRDHDTRQPIGNAIAAGIEPDGFTVRMRFLPWGTSAIADETRRLVKAGGIRGVSIGFIPRVWDPVDKRDPWAGTLYREIEILEVAVTSVPANRESMVIGKALAMPCATAAAPAPLAYAGTLAQRQAQADFDAARSPAALERRRRLARVARWRAETGLY